MKPEYCNSSAIVLDPENGEITIASDFGYVDIAKDKTEFNHAEVSKIVMSVEKSENLFKNLKNCIDQYTDYIHAKVGEQNEQRKNNA